MSTTIIAVINFKSVGDLEMIKETSVTNSFLTQSKGHLDFD